MKTESDIKREIEKLESRLLSTMNNKELTILFVGKINALYWVLN